MRTPGIVITGRGGAGKTTMTSNLAVYFRKRLQRDVLTVDGDLYLPKLGFHFGLYLPRISLHDVLKDPSLNPFKAVYHDERTGVYIVPGSPNLYDVLNLDHRQLARVVWEFKKRYDIIIVDSPVGIPFDTLSTFNLVDYQLIIVELERSPIYSVERMIENEVVKLKAIGDEFGLKVGVILNKVREARAEIGGVIELVEGSIGVPVLGVVALDERVPMALNEGLPVVEAYPKCRASVDIQEAGENLVKWMFGRKVEKQEGFFQSLFRTVREFLNPYLHWE
ncbi:septum site-determining protein MinD [Thermococcus profundus]|uniref:Septum site-determining protein MinD n=1 Tax=Thermococcus profundus TaxID=49899 RepID=A0A2Z2MB65_THEPR|nr:MinD/ParA family protein [Thermococcus profundus]ASJ01842.1 septum site-determining protein MinD [Thermococcus profundus]